MSRIGVFSGVFDPVHKGHVAFSLAAIQKVKLDKVYFLVEAKPRRKTHVSHLAHRIAMIELATKPYAKLKVLDLPDAQFSVAKTLPRLKKQFADDKLFLLLGSDTLEHLADWSLVETLLAKMNLIVGVRTYPNEQKSKDLALQLGLSPDAFTVIDSPMPAISSGQIRDSVHKGLKYQDQLPGVQNYIKEHWLYVTPSGSSSEL